MAADRIWTNTMIFLQIEVNGYDRNFTYIVGDEETKEAIVIDPSEDEEKVEKEAKEKGLTIKYVVNTHGHSDHTSGNEYFLSKGAELVDENFKLGSIDVKMIRTPGHTEDSKCVLVENKLLTGDTLFVGKIGGVFYEGGEKVQWETLGALMKLDPEIEVWPGHDYGTSKSSTIGKEKETNPFIQCKTFEEFVYLKTHWAEYKKAHNLS